MIALKDAIFEINTGKVYFSEKEEETTMVTEGEVVIYLRMLENFFKLQEEGLLHTAQIKNGTEIFAIGEYMDDVGDDIPCIMKTTYLYNFTECEFGELGEGYFMTELEANEKIKSLKQEDTYNDKNNLS